MFNGIVYNTGQIRFIKKKKKKIKIELKQNKIKKDRVVSLL